MLSSPMQILCLGLNHRTAPVELREQLNFPGSALQTALARFCCQPGSQPDGPAEFVILSTCNRLELYTATPADSDPGKILTGLIEFLVETRGVPAAEFESHLYQYTGLKAAQHLCRVAAGLDSMILGEPQILGQVAEAYEAAQAAGTVGPVLAALFRAAIRAGKRARSETGISRNPASVSSVAVRLAEQIVGDLSAHNVLVIGAGEMGELAVAALRARGVQRLTVVNRTYHRAVELSQRRGGDALSFDQLAEAVHAADIVISSTSAPHIIISPDLARRAMADRAQPLVLIDIAMPRDVHPSVTDIPGVHLYDLDNIHTRLDSAIAERRNEIPRVEAIVSEEVSAYEAWLREADVLPLITDLRAKAERIRRRELARTLHHLPELDPAVRQQVERLSESIVNKLLHEPTRLLRAEAANGQAADYAETVRLLFGLANDNAHLEAD